ncbi:MAG TPA: hypothetical protein VND65_18960 [Candidatus Binatia bacterium]|nr:hypothetical protein [Candidatus Binatia bacterium]
MKKLAANASNTIRRLQREISREENVMRLKDRVYQLQNALAKQTPKVPMLTAQHARGPNPFDVLL